MMRLKTNKGDEICNYFIALEKCFKCYSYYQCKASEFNFTKCAEEMKQLTLEYKQDIDTKNKIIENQKILVKKLENYKKMKNKEEIVYINSTRTYIDNGLFKIGKTTIGTQKKKRNT